ncbi:hypothetical protein TRVA0_001S05226 [Trichomonascus vanleenenianus]|uniref:uncharacterized protein n=1 Tax=Trichomonascus vanleenenianus TaxID=2268995 RepID=UPI003ECA83B9
MTSTAKLTFEIENNVVELDADDAIYSFDADSQRQLQKEAPWKKDPHYFRKVRISSVALIRMAMHARSGGSIEVMGVMTGKILPNEFVVMDAYPLPVEGTETRVNAQAEGYEYMVEYLSSLQEVGRKENIVGWYHSHPGYGCWLSGIDVGTQHQNQQFQDPYLAIVVDPNRTIASGKVDIGAFRTFPEGYSDKSGQGGYQSIPLAKMEDFGVHADRYYALEVSYFKSSLDDKLLELLWSKYWTSTLSQNPLITNMGYNTEQLQDVASKTEKLVPMLGDVNDPFWLLGDKNESKSKTGQLSVLVEDSSKVSREQVHGLLLRELNARLFAS